MERRAKCLFGDGDRTDTPLGGLAPRGGCGALLGMTAGESQARQEGCNGSKGGGDRPLETVALGPCLRVAMGCGRGRRLPFTETVFVLSPTIGAVDRLEAWHYTGANVVASPPYGRGARRRRRALGMCGAVDRTSDPRQRALQVRRLSRGARRMLAWSRKQAR